MYLTFDEDGYIDFEEPIHLTPEQAKKVVEAFRKVLGVDMPLDDKFHEPFVTTQTQPERHNWTNVERAKLFSPKSNDTLSAEMGVKSMTVGIMRANLMSQFYKWRKAKNSTATTDEILHDFLVERGWIS